MTDLMDADKRQAKTLSKPMTMILLCLRLAVGWHFLYEGVAKLLTPGWTAAPYLQLARGPFSGFFHALGSSPGLVRAIDLLNIWGLTLIGLALMLGCFSRLASVCGIVMLAFYYLAQPPLIQTDYRIPLEGHYLLVNKNVVELLVLVIFLALPPGTLWGLGRLVRRWRTERAAKPAAEPEKPAAEPVKVPAGLLGSLSRREALEDLAAAPLLGVLGYSAEKKYHYEKVHAVTGATVKIQNFSLTDLKGELPLGALGKFKMSRLILGNNLMRGYAHSRDLIYVPSLFRAYNHDGKIFETFELAERAGINTFMVPSTEMPAFNKYREMNNSKVMTLCTVYPTPQDLKTNIDKAIDYGGTTFFLQGANAEIFVRNGQIDMLGKSLEHIKSQGYLAGVGAHSIDVPIACEKAGLPVDYYVKTLHHDQYWSAHPRENRIEGSTIAYKLMADHNQWHDNMFDLFPEKTIEFMHGVKKPWVAFKVLAGGAIQPKDGFKFAFENGADFMCVGMFDYQIVEDVNMAVEVLANLKNRPREWFT